jgi:DNA-binding MurR/RpiR family transcriptional regulator
MSSLLKIRAGRDQMSAIERRIADFILDNSHLLRDYSSQQLADALGISQSSVVKFSQKLGFKGYPDLKFSVGEDFARSDAGDDGRPGPATGIADTPHSMLAEALWQAKARAERETRLINPPDALDAIAAALGGAGKVFIVGLGADGIPARALALALSSLGILAVHHFDTALMASAAALARSGDVLMVFSEHGRQPALCQVGRQVRDQGGLVVSVTRHTANPLRALAGAALLVSAHDDRVHVEPLLYQAALQHLLDLLFLLLCEDGSDRPSRLAANLDRARSLSDP